MFLVFLARQKNQVSLKTYPANYNYERDHNVLFVLICSSDLSLSWSSTNRGPAGDQHQTAAPACAQPRGKTMRQGHLCGWAPAQGLLHQVYATPTFSQLPPVQELAVSLLACCLMRISNLNTQCNIFICVLILFFFCSFPNLGILHVTKKNVSKTLEERMSEAYRLGYNYGIVIHPEIDSFQGETHLPRDLTGNCVCVCGGVHFGRWLWTLNEYTMCSVIKSSTDYQCKLIYMMDLCVWAH